VMYWHGTIVILPYWNVMIFVTLSELSAHVTSCKTFIYSITYVIGGHNDLWLANVVAKH
jgi:hypothetical protein